MPKLVDHAERRQAIVAAAWRLIAARGIDGITMRDLAAEAGYCNGALSHYFSGKDEILRTAFELVLEATNQRIDQAVRGKRGLGALRKMCYEIMPLTEETRLEARIAISLWQRALTDRNLEQINNRAVGEWRRQVATHLQYAIDDGDMDPLDVDTHADLIMTTMMGLQITAVLDRQSTPRRTQLAIFEAILDQGRNPAD